MKKDNMAVLSSCSKQEKDDIFKLICTLKDDELDRVQEYILDLKSKRK